MLQERLVLETVLEAMQAATVAPAPTGQPNPMLAEAFDKLRAMLGREDQGWVPLSGSAWGSDERFGLRLEDLKAWDKKILESMYGAAWMGRGFRLRYSNIWKDGIQYANIPGEGDTAQRGKKNVDKIIKRTGNQAAFFGDEARRQREAALFSAGARFWIGRESTKDLTAIPLRQITDQLLDPDGFGEVWAYKREWSHFNHNTGKREPQARWYFTDKYVDHRNEFRKIGDDPQSAAPVDREYVIFDQHANRYGDLVYGAPDALAAWVWNGIARDAYLDATTMTRALATFAFKASTKTNTGGQNASVQFANPQGAGSTAVVGQNDLTALASAGKAYDFSALLALPAVIASALDVSVVSLTSNPGDAGSSYSAAQTLDLPTRLAMEARRAEHIELDKRVLTWMGVPDPDVSFVPFDSTDDIYRDIQALGLEYSYDLYTRQEMRDHVDDLRGRPNGKVPTDAKRPSVLLAKAMADAGATVSTKDPNTTGDGTATATTKSGGTPKQTPSPAQGKSNGTGGQGSASGTDLRRDTLK